MARKELPQMTPWVIVSPDGWEWLGYMEDEAHAWDIALGWPSPEEIAEHKANGWYATEATVTWKRPGRSPDAGKMVPDDRIAAALALPACDRLREWAAIGPVQRAAVQAFADALDADGVETGAPDQLKEPK